MKIFWVFISAMLLVGAFAIWQSILQDSKVDPELAVEHGSHEHSKTSLRSDSRIETLVHSETSQQRYHEYIQQLQAGEAIKEKLTELEQLTEEEKQEQAETILSDVDEQFAESRISNTEALFLRLTLMKYVLSKDEYLKYAKDLTQQHKLAVEKRWDQYQANRDPAFIKYKQREKEVVAEILAMEDFPDGMTRNEYLTLKLHELKQEVYAIKP